MKPNAYLEFFTHSSIMNIDYKQMGGERIANLFILKHSPGMLSFAVLFLFFSVSLNSFLWSLKALGVEIKVADLLCCLLLLMHRHLGIPTTYLERLWLTPWALSSTLWVSQKSENWYSYSTNLINIFKTKIYL